VKEAFDAAGVDVWFDQHDLPPGVAYQLEIERHIENCSYFVPLISRHTATSRKRFFFREWEKALEELKSYPRGFPFIQPLLIDDTPINAPGIDPKFATLQATPLKSLSQLVEVAKQRIRERRR
jgi:hypothetical protein